MNVTEICEELQRMQRERSVLIKSRIMLSNRLQAIVAGRLGYHAGLTDSERMKLFREAGKHIRMVMGGEIQDEYGGIIFAHQNGIDAFLTDESKVEKPMRESAALLPVASWTVRTEQRG